MTAAQFWLTIAAFAFVWLFASGAGLLAILQAGDERKIGKAKEHLDRLRREWEMEEKRYRKTLRTDPPALIRIKELGWRMPCGHRMHQWDSDRLVCLQCVLEGRQVARDGGRQS